MTDRKQALIDLRDKVKAGDFWGFGEWGYLDGRVFDYGGKAHEGSLDAAKALRLALNLPVPEKMNSDARIELLDILEALIAQEDQCEQ